ncbi:hypothetical protein O6H91_12G044200 [Diphasiastrum complanatum]|uniref:Uncharacterized protein n=1 Tax=Diphasiastrum complanatum TaxID=34168 RepID=A0ACC2C1B2_DIPCM|nr:hypothetical protein O6H91_12G044200 [Diphasiastrum complanatum]
MAYYGLAVNFINYLAYNMHYKFSEAATIVTNYLGAAQILPLVGAFIADSYLGRYWTIVIFSLIYLLIYALMRGLVLLTISGIVPTLRSSNAGCNQIKLFTVGCERPSTLQALYLFTALYVIALGTGGIRPCVSPFGADQFDVALTREKNLLGRFLDKAAVIIHWDDAVEDNYVNPWHLCTVTQVEEVKALVKLIPVWLVCFIPQTVTQTLVNFTVQQGNTMNRKIGPHFTVPSATIPNITAIFVLVLLPIYDVILVPLLRDVSPTIHVASASTIMATIVVALFETHRHRVAWATHVATNPQQVVPINAFWLSMQYMFLGVAEVFFLVGQLEFFYCKAPDGVHSIGTSYVYTANAIGSFIVSLVVKVVQQKIGRHGNAPWLAENINLGHLDRFYWLLSAMSLGNFLIFLVVAYFYRYKRSSIDIKKQTTVETIDW